MTRNTFIFLKQPTKDEIWRFKDSLNHGLSETSLLAALGKKKIRHSFFSQENRNILT